MYLTRQKCYCLITFEFFSPKEVPYNLTLYDNYYVRFCIVVQEFLLSLWQSLFANEIEQNEVVQKRHESANLNV